MGCGAGPLRTALSGEVRCADYRSRDSAGGGIRVRLEGCIAKWTQSTKLHHSKRSTQAPQSGAEYTRSGFESGNPPRTCTAKSNNQFAQMVPGAGFEPARVATGDFKSPASAIPPPRRRRQHPVNESARLPCVASEGRGALRRCRRFGSCCRRARLWACAPSPPRRSSLQSSR